MENEEITFDKLVKEILDTVSELDQFNTDGKALSKMDESEWKKNVSAYREKYPYYAEGFEDDNEFKSLLLFKLLHEDTEQAEGGLDYLIETLETMFHKTVEIHINESNVSTVRITDIVDGHEHTYFFDSRIVPLRV